MKKHYFIVIPDGKKPVNLGDLVVIDFKDIPDEVRADITLLSERHDTAKFLQLATRRLTGFFQNYCHQDTGEFIFYDCEPEIIAYVISENGTARVCARRDLGIVQDEAYKLSMMKLLADLDVALNFG